ncbi:7852_t:CDS:2 [Scutellospora calospora]|uniref:7852_t:CDS:1 n=1 Tax=Scutellospora calospora TaxID=85575 RepID=A0ACA9JVM7_9GLOM|nr:7852_t:CDS:2 [Scutellospora calospora]
MKTLLYNLVFIVLLLAVLPTGFAQTTQTIHYSNFTYDEISYQDNLTGNPPHVLAIRHYQNNADVAVIRVGRVNYYSGNNTCFEQRLLLRVLQGNGSVIEINYTNTSEIQDINFCYRFRNPLNFYPLFDQYILVTYTHATNTSDKTTFMDRGMVLNWNGTVASFIDLGPSYLEPITNYSWYPNEYFVNNINPQMGFFRLSAVNGTRSFKWQQYAYGNYYLLSNDTVPTDFSTSFQVTVIQTLYGGYAIIYANTTNIAIPSNNANSTSTAHLTPSGGIYALIFNYNQTKTPSKIILYESQMQNITFNTLFCSVDFASIGHSCIVSAVGPKAIQTPTNITTTFTTTTTPPVGIPTAVPVTTVVPGQPITTYTTELFYVNIRFLSSGSLLSLDSIIPPPSSVTNVNIRTLPFGGYATLWRTATVLAANYNFSLFDENNQLSDYNFPINPIIANLVGAFDILQNNTMLVAQNESLNSWNILSILMPKLSPYNDNGYGNLHVGATYPPNSPPNELLNKISLNNKVINITFENPVTFGTGSLKIFSMDGTLRQTLNIRNCDSSKCNATGNIVSLNVFDCTFNEPNGQYYIQMDNSFVLDAEYNEPLLGIDPNKWIFQTVTNQLQEKYDGGIQGALRLTDEGTIHYQNLSSSNQSDFINTLQNELTLMIPTEKGRLYSINNNTQNDPNQKSRIFISLSIKGAKSGQKLFSTDVSKYLNLLIINKETTGISTGTTTKYLDASYGYQKIQSVAEFFAENRSKFIIFIVAIVLFLLMFLVAKMRTRPEDKDVVENIAILQLGVTLSRFATYILFVIFDSSTLSFLFLPR